MSDLVDLFEAKAKAEFSDLAIRIKRCAGSRGPILGSGNALADIFLVKAAPDADESVKGAAFAGRSGEAMAKAAERLKIPHGVLYQTNLVKCASTSDECDRRCRNWLAEELGIVQPGIVLAMGAAAFAAVCDVVGFDVAYEPGTRIFRTGRPAITASVDFEDAMSNESAKSRLWRDLQAVTADYVDRQTPRGRREAASQRKRATQRAARP